MMLGHIVKGGLCVAVAAAGFLMQPARTAGPAGGSGTGPAQIHH